MIRHKLPTEVRTPGVSGTARRGILVVALNPSVDAEWQVPQVVWEEKNVLAGERRWAGGKGINVARWLRHLGADARLLLPLGGSSGRELAAGLRREGIAFRACPLAEATRVNVIVSTERQGQLRFNPPGPLVTPSERAALARAFQRLLRRSSCVVLSGSLPRGLSTNIYAEMIREADAAGLPALLDCEGEPLRQAVRARPFLVKPNEAELRAWHGGQWHSPRACLEAARALSTATGGWVLVSRGAQVALLVHAHGCLGLQASPPRVKAVNTVGAGDALLAAAAREVVLGRPPEEWLRAGLAAGTAATLRPAGELVSPHEVARFARQIEVRPLALRGRPRR